MGKNGETVIPANHDSNTDICTNGFRFCSLPDAQKKVTLRIVDIKTGKLTAARIHVHSRHGEYLAPVNRHRIPNPFMFEDYGADFVNGNHFSTYINGLAEFKLPLGEVCIEITKGFEIKPVYKRLMIEENTGCITIGLEHVLPWRQKGWVTADTHVHFLSPHTALLEGEGEGVNVVNLLAAQFGEAFPNIADFDGKTTLGSSENGGTGEYLVRVGTENRQHILGHISLLGYEEEMILPLSSGGSDESALGEAVEATLSEWAIKCREQKGIAVLSHHPVPRAEGAAALVLDLIDAVEAFGPLNSRDPVAGISPYSLSDWYRYLNCGYHVPVVGGTDKMSAGQLLGAVRTYALIKNEPFTYDSWKNAVRKGLTFVTCGALMDLSVNGCEMGAKINLPAGGGTIDVDWQVGTLVHPVSGIELIVNSVIKEVRQVDLASGCCSGCWSLGMNDSGWLALRVRGQKGEILAHSSAVMVFVDGKTCFNYPDAVTILEQIEGCSAYIRTLGTKAEENTYKKLLMTITSAYRTLHNRMHQNGAYHKHTVLDDHHGK